MNNFEDAFKKLAEIMKTGINTELMTGKSFQLGEFLCVPVISVMAGTGGMSGDGKFNFSGRIEGPCKGEGLGAAFGMFPVGFLVTKGDEIQFIPALQLKGLFSAFEHFPGQK